MTEVIFAVSNRSHGNMLGSYSDDADANLKSFLGRPGLASKQAVFIECRGSDTIQDADEIEPGSWVACDALITSQSGRALVLPIADCLGIGIYDPVKRVIALAHAGWKGTDKRIVQKVIRALESHYNSNPRDLKVWSSPAIQAQSYCFDDVTQKDDPQWQPFIERRDGRYCLDFVGYNKQQLLEAGVMPSNIDFSRIDTATDDNYFSHYQAMRDGETEGRFAVVLAMT